MSDDETLRRALDAVPNGDAGIHCPRARSEWTPCIARDGASALADDELCVGCGTDPTLQLAELAMRYPPALATIPASPAEAADLLRDNVSAYVEGKP